MSALTRWINPSLYERAEGYADIAAGTLARIAPDGEYSSNIIRRLPDGERGEQAQAFLAWVEGVSA